MLRWCLLFAVLQLALCSDQEPMLQDADQFKEHMEKHYENLHQVRHPRPENRNAWMEARNYVFQQFHLMSLEPKLHCFNTSVKFGHSYDQDHMVEGCNIVGEIPGESELHRIIVGAHFDTSVGDKNSKPLRENGAGVATLIEVARAMDLSIRFRRFRPKYTTVFVAFDLNTLEESTRQSSAPGSQFFVEEYVNPGLLRSPPKGAYIIDSIANYNSDPQTQSLPSDFQDVFPEGFKEISESNSRKGNFLAGVTKSNGEKLLKDFADHYDTKGDYRLQKLVTPDFGDAKTYQMFEEFDSHAFWGAEVPTVLLTDTSDDYRRVKESCDQNCDYKQFGSAQTTSFLYSTYEALSMTLIQQQTDYEPSGSTSALSSVALLVLGAAVVRMFANQ